MTIIAKEITNKFDDVTNTAIKEITEYFVKNSMLTLIVDIMTGVGSIAFIAGFIWTSVYFINGEKDFQTHSVPNFLMFSGTAVVRIAALVKIYPTLREDTFFAKLKKVYDHDEALGII